MAENKTVYILGAGASASAYIPTQAGILNLVFSLTRQSFYNSKSSTEFLEMDINEPLQKLQNFYTTFDSFRSELGQFILSNFASADKATQYAYVIAEAEKIAIISENNLAEKDDMKKKAYEKVKSVDTSLEDLFTLFDNVAIGREHFRIYSPQKMDEIHTRLKMCIIYAIAYKIAAECDNSAYSRFSKMLLSQRMASSQKDDNLAVITMNWDDVLEQVIYQQCKEHNGFTTRKNNKIYPDLCFYDYAYHKNDMHIPSTHIKAQGCKNIIILKMHGSLSWLECPKCGRILTDYSSEIAYEEFGEARCPYCDITNENDGPFLRSLIITPTFLKSLNNLNVKNIWQNAYIDICEADHIVFIGYSLPDADFEMRCLLKKAVKESADIKVVLTDTDNPNNYYKLLKKSGLDDTEISNIISKMSLPHSRYDSFFGDENVTFEYGGFDKYLDDLGV